MNILKKLVPNSGSRNGNTPKFIVIHTAMGNRLQVHSTFMNEPKSSHYLCNSDGSVWQFCEESNSAWHAGILVRPTATILRQYPFINCNLISIGIENEGDDKNDIPDIQYQRNAELVADICERYEIPCDRIHIINHREINGAKTCPGKISVDRIIRMAQKIREDRTREVTPEELSIYTQIINLLKQAIAMLLKGRQK